jgi:RimJ/RimL family protein N-acetyltransferase
MISDNFWLGERVRLTALTKEDTAQITGWFGDAGLLRLWGALPARPQTEATVSKDLEEAQKNPNAFVLAIRPIDDDELLGYLELDGILWASGVGWIAIGIGDRANWGKGYGREAMTLALDYAFRELNLHRVQLTVFAYNERAIALYEKLGFQREGVYREFLHRDGKRYDMYLYGLLRAEWESRSVAT